MLAITQPTMAADAPAPPETATPQSATPPAEQAHLSYMNYTLTADWYSLDWAHQQVDAKGHVIITLPQGTFYADSAFYDAKQQKGDLLNVAGTIRVFHFSARQVKIPNKKTIFLDDVALTTCSNPHPHYRLLAHKMDVYAGGPMSAQNVTLEIGGHKTITLPQFHQDPNNRDDLLATPMQFGGHSALDGYFILAQYNYDLRPDAVLTVSGRLGTENLFRGGLFLHRSFYLPGQTAPSRITIGVTRKEDVANRLIDTGPAEASFSLSQLSVSRLPCAQVDLAPIPLPGPLQHFSVVFSGGAGIYNEQPTGITAARAQISSIFSSPLFPIGPLLLSGQFGARAANAEEQTNLAALSQVTLATRPTSPLYYSVSYNHRASWGHTPFLFDRVQVPDEIAGDMELPIVHDTFAVGLWNSYDLRAKRHRNFGVAAIFHTDCLSYGINYDLSARSIGFGLVLNALGNFHHHSSGIGFTQ